ncbi:hypothetical protein GCM10020255_045540 [Rhodococcus baikonurensis]
MYDELVDFRAAAITVFDAPNDSLGERMVSLFTKPLESYKPLSMSLLFMSGVSEESNRKLRENYSTQMIDTLAARLSGPDARLRAELAMSMVVGVAIMRRRMMAAMPPAPRTRWLPCTHHLSKSSSTGERRHNSCLVNIRSPNVGERIFT